MLNEIRTKGIARYLVDERYDGEPIHLHISEVGPGQSSHPPHQHPGVESFYIFEGTGTLLLDGEEIALSAGEAVVIDSTRMHGLVASDAGPLRYMVIIRP
ncbi:MAG TPA: cupin domain-containing protein [Roseiflexaceae bacterium]|nr:cupin domain-containing protein [Roseiflexaceae bacterium]